MNIVVSAADQKTMKSMVVEITNCLEKIDGQKEQIKSIAERAKDEFGIKPKFVRKLAKTMFDSSYADLQSENEAFEYLYEAICEGKNV